MSDSGGDASQVVASSTRAPDAAWVTGEYQDEAALARDLAQAITAHPAKAGRSRWLEMTDETASKAIAERLRAIMKDRGVTQKALAAKLNVTPARVSHMLKRPAKAKFDTLRRIADALGVRLREIL
jgi:ribosome-binding protein aMBF1 (putative translation factor)